uniref:Uncharacterized protein n=1 Tax=Picea glauca TaxID=3330 RepID=A0A101LZP3_PICGL|nr:hypothetical protein ABT39_MTgene5294 [Picea glauca]
MLKEVEFQHLLVLFRHLQEFLRSDVHCPLFRYPLLLLGVMPQH